jgi:hypothetical protein
LYTAQRPSNHLLVMIGAAAPYTTSPRLRASARTKISG